METLPAGEIFICGTRFRIAQGDIGFAYAYANVKECQIEFNETCAGDLMRETLLHEVLHAVDYLLLTDGTHLMTAMNRRMRENELFRLNEPQVLALSRGLWMTLTDPRNRDIVRWMLSPEVLP